MTYEDEPRKMNHGGISRSGNVTGFTNTYRHPSDRRLGFTGWLLIVAIFGAFACLGMAVTVWAETPMEGNP